MVGYSTTTYKMKLYCKHLDWLIETKKLYNEVEEFYHNIYLQHTELWELSSQNALRELEKLTLTDKKGTPPVIKLPFKNVPVYFRRSAINCALGIANSYLSKLKIYQQQKSLNKDNKKSKYQNPSQAKTFSTSPIFYKHMYKDFDNGKIILKLWTGTGWVWTKCKYKGREIPKNIDILSPTVVIRKNRVSMHIPVKSENVDARPVKERMEANENICGITFTNHDTFAVCCANTADGRTIASRFIKGGDRYVHHSKRLYERIKSNQKDMGKNQKDTSANKKYWTHLNNLGDYWAHKVSREIINFCIEYNVKTISLARFDDKIISYAATKNTKYTPLYLSLRIRRYLEYKAWQTGIVITEVRAANTSSKCTICSSNIIKTYMYEKTFRCKSGHSGNKDLNTAKNVGKLALKKFGKLSA